MAISLFQTEEEISRFWAVNGGGIVAAVDGNAAVKIAPGAGRETFIGLENKIPGIRPCDGDANLAEPSRADRQPRRRWTDEGDDAHGRQCVCKDRVGDGNGRLAGE